MPCRFLSSALRAFAAAALFAALAGPVAAEDLLQIYREAQKQDPTLAAARSQWEATQERVPQARAGLLPQVAAAGQANANTYDATLNTSPRTNISQQYGLGNLTFSASQPLYRPANVVALEQAREQVTQSDFSLGTSQQDLILRTAVAYFDVLLAEYNVELAEQQKLAVSEQLAQAKRNFEVGTATITDTNEAQARYDSIVATEIQARNDLERRRSALAAIIGAAMAAVAAIPGPAMAVQFGVPPVSPPLQLGVPFPILPEQRPPHVTFGLLRVTLQVQPQCVVARGRANRRSAHRLFAAYPVACQPDVAGRLDERLRHAGLHARRPGLGPAPDRRTQPPLGASECGLLI